MLPGLSNPYVDGVRIPRTNINTENYPFYNRKQFENPHMEDGPYNEDSFTAETTLVGINANGKITSLGTFTWGYYNMYGGVFLAVPQFSTTPSSFQQSIINKYNSK